MSTEVKKMGWTIKEIQEWVLENPPGLHRAFVRVVGQKDLKTNRIKYAIKDYGDRLEKITGLFYYKETVIVSLVDGFLHNEIGPARVYLDFNNVIKAGIYCINGVKLKKEDLLLKLMVLRDGFSIHSNTIHFVKEGIIK